MTDVLEFAEQIADESWQLHRCPKCGEEKPRDAFYGDAAKPRGRASWCIACMKPYQRARREAGLNKRYDPAPDGYQPCQSCGEVKHATEYTASRDLPATPPYLAGRKRICKSCHSRRHRVKRYGEEAVLDFESGTECQNPACDNERAEMDHDHATGEYRWSLCRVCNLALPGGITPERLRGLADLLDDA